METKGDKTPDDLDSFERLIQGPELRARLIKRAQLRGILPDDCEDIASDTLAEAIRKKTQYNPARGSLSSWIICINENVIRDYRRRKNAQKRKPQHGIVSLQASPEDDYGRSEPKDAIAEENSKISVEIQHYIDSAKLSEKEANVIAARRNKKNQSPDATCSSSTARRALKKLQQVSSDEKFRDCPRGPEPSECAYGKIPAAERSAAVLFDQLRRTPWFVDAIAQWRKSSEWNHAQAFLQSQAALERFPLRILDEHWPKQLSRYRDAAHQRNRDLRRRFEAAVEITLAFPEWPVVGYCQLAAHERRKRLEQFGWTLGAEPFWEITESTFEIFVDAADAEQDLNKSPQAASDVYSSTHLVRIDWRYPIETIVASFRRWADKQAKRDLHRITQAGRPATTNLVGFACIRLVDDFRLSLAQAMSWLKERYGAPIPKTPERLERALKAARDELKDFLPSPAEIGV